MEIKKAMDIISRTAPGSRIRITGPGEFYDVILGSDGYTLTDAKGNTHNYLNHAEIEQFAIEPAGVTIWI